MDVLDFSSEKIKTKKMREMIQASYANQITMALHPAKYPQHRHSRKCLPWMGDNAGK